MTLELSDSVPRIKTFEELLRPYGIKETVRTGSIAMQKRRGFYEAVKATL